MARRLLRIGDVSPASTSQPPMYVSDAQQLEQVRSGQMISPLGDYLMEWDEECLPPSRLEPWRREGDPLSDAVVRELQLRPGQDGLEVLLTYLERPLTDQAECVRSFWQEISHSPPEPISAFPTQSTNIEEATPRASLQSPTYHPAPTVAQGQAVFWRYSAQIFSALLHFSLAGGFSAVRVVNVMRETNYLTGNAKEATYRRLLETTQAILDYMNDLTPITGVGWKSAIRVRMLHSSVRARLLGKRGVKNEYDEHVDGIPINQEDLLATLGSFAIAPLWSLRRMKILLTEEEEEAYVAVWRHIGFYLGVSPSRLAQYYAGPRPVSHASKLFTCITMHLFDTDNTGIDHRLTSTFRLLSAVAGRPPRYTPISYHLAISRFLLGDGLADRLALPRTGTRLVWRLKVTRWIEWALVAFGRIYSERWEVERVACTRILVSMIVCWQLGSRRTKFTIKTFAADVMLPLVVERDSVPEESKGISITGKEEKPIDPDDDEMDPEIQVGPEAGKKIIGRWRWLLLEMMAADGASRTIGVAELGEPEHTTPEWQIAWNSRRAASWNSDWSYNNNLLEPLIAAPVP
ncbi:MAG: hypothetical protein TREMPRED_004561 [Tremellales sp. Tagirdzhanova-0007]|nr:MAG: hypothetical protein TREMPRED_004561 [Tremellales sp. Tagirdzhanova-0007]